MNKNYCGIIFRDVPEDSQNMMEALGFLLGANEWKLRATGDLAAISPFVRGCSNAGGEYKSVDFNNPSIASISYAHKMFPKFKDFSDGKQKYVCAIISSILGENCQSLVKFVCLYGESNRFASQDVKKLCLQNKIDCYDISLQDVASTIQGKIDLMVQNFKEK